MIKLNSRTTVIGLIALVCAIVQAVATHDYASLGSSVATAVGLVFASDQG